MTISNEAIEAGARALHEFNPTFAQDEWDATESDYRDWRKEQATAALSAAAPFIQARAKAEALEQLAVSFEATASCASYIGTEDIMETWLNAAQHARADQLEGKTR